MKCLEQSNVFFGLSDEKILWIIKIDNNGTIQMAKKPFYTNQTEVKKTLTFFYSKKKISNSFRYVLLIIEIYF
jgi:hypothetical protein